MKKIIVLIMVLVVNILANDVKFYKPSFDCSKAKKNNIEYKICSDEKLSQLDTNLSQIYNSFNFMTKEIKQDQREWLKKRDKCEDNKCTQIIYQNRIEELSTSLANQKTFPKLYLDAMKEAQENMEIVWNPIIYKDQQKLIDTGLAFKDDLFRFKNITFKPSLIENVQYDDKKLREILGVCYDYRFDLEIKEYPNKKYYVDGQRYWVKDERKPLRDINISVWKTTAQDKEWLFIKPTTSGSAYLVSTSVCKQKKLKNTLVNALNYNEKQLKRSRPWLNNAYIVKYKNQEHVFDIFLIHKNKIKIKLINTLGTTTLDEPTIWFTGSWIHIITFEQKQQGEK